MADKAYLILANGITFEGNALGTQGDVTGEVVFTTGMTGYLETLTDPGYYGQMIVQTFPLIGNYGIIPADFESQSVACSAYIVKHPCQDPSNFRSEGDLDTFLKAQGIVGISGIDTRKLTKIIRDNGTMTGKITSNPPTPSDQDDAKTYSVQNAVAAVSPKEIQKLGGTGHKIAMLNFGAKASIASALIERGCEVWSLPHDATADDVMKVKPDGIVLSNGPGNPADNTGIVKTIEELDKSGVPIFGIGLGHLLLAMAKGHKIKRMPLGHRGYTPVKDTQTGHVFITRQNHCYIADVADSACVNVNDGTCEGLDYGKSFSVQFDPTDFLFDRFIERMGV